ncbi:glycosyltransferase family 2 protein [Agrobacterium tumefaciens]|uniref:glycosyltransferase family 2 protein n=1 Tax=Agrobacterium tumefaciens TaxID=358 RepID=UPI00287F0639|nr:glycosyltransferase family 2 protein [Agrobacterium tumefaciens]MDS7594766.1 glycosyltransferase family 2 protein [Agrobacterium tumefaciens]
MGNRDQIPLYDVLVSVGVPTYNRADLLELALKKLLAQTHKNIEIIVSDNASTNPSVAGVIASYASKDSRIRAFRQPSNIGAMPNFLFVLREARGEFFMWAADDDEWSPDCIEFYLANIGSAGLVSGNFETVFHAQNKVLLTEVPRLDPDKPVYKNAEAFIANLQPSMIYGLHKTECLRANIPAENFDFWDCALVYSILLDQGVKTVAGARYRAGVHSLEYEIKLANPAVAKLQFRGFLVHALKETLRCPKISSFGKFSLFVAIVKLVQTLKKHHRARVREQYSRNNEK